MKLITLIILMYSSSVFCQEDYIINYPPKYLPKKLFGYGLFTIGEKSPKFETVLQRENSYLVKDIDGYFYGITLPGTDQITKSCGRKVRKSIEYQNYLKVRSELTIQEEDNFYTISRTGIFQVTILQ